MAKYQNAVTLTEGMTLVTPEDADLILEHMNFKGQRNKGKHEVALLVDHIRSGSFAKGHPLSFAILNGVAILINGQHRLEAVKVSGKAQWFNVCFTDVKTEAEVKTLWSTYDTGMSVRTNSQILGGFDLAQKHGIRRTTANKLYEAALLIECGFQRQHYLENPKVRNMDFRIKCFERWSEHARTFEEYVLASDDKVLVQKIFLQGIFAAALATIRHQPSHARTFWRGITENNGLRKGDARRTLYMDIKNRIYNRGSQSQAEKSVAIAWNHFFLTPNRDLKSIKIYPDKDFKLAGTPWD